MTHAVPCPNCRRDMLRDSKGNHMCVNTECGFGRLISSAGVKVTKNGSWTVYESKE